MQLAGGATNISIARGLDNRSSELGSSSGVKISNVAERGSSILRHGNEVLSITTELQLLILPISHDFLRRQHLFAVRSLTEEVGTKDADMKIVVTRRRDRNRTAEEQPTLAQRAHNYQDRTVGVR
jgi:hypothetical protein